MSALKCNSGASFLLPFGCRKMLFCLSKPCGNSFVTPSLHSQTIVKSNQCPTKNYFPHFFQSDQFMEHFGEEHKTRGGCPADWVWIVSPSYGALTPLFHQETLNYCLSPSFEYQEKVWEMYGKESEKSRKSFQSVALAVLFAANLFKKRYVARPKVSFCSFIKKSFGKCTEKCRKSRENPPSLSHL